MDPSPSNPYSSPSANLYGHAEGASGDIISPGTIAVLAGTKPWVRFMSVMLWIGVALMLLIAVVMGIVMGIGLPGTGLDTGPFGSAGLIVMVAMYALMAVLYVYPAMKLWKYASRIGRLGATRTVTDLDAALHEQRKFWKFLGVLMIIMMCLYAVGIVAMGAVGAMGMGTMKSLPVQP